MIEVLPLKLQKTFLVQKILFLILDFLTFVLMVGIQTNIMKRWFSILLSLSFLSQFLIVTYKSRVPFCHIINNLGREHSWKDYIYSLSTLYDDSEPFAISEFISGFSIIIVFSPILLSNNSNNFLLERLFYRIKYITKIYFIFTLLL